MTSQLSVARTLTRISDRTRLGPDEQVDDKALAFVPTDPALTDPFLTLVEDWFSTPGFEWHPHRGLETVTLVVDGVLEHGDNLGHAGSLEPGEVQWMTAGSGIIHRELAYRDEHAHVLQLWLNLPAAKKMTPSRYQDLRRATIPRVHAPGVVIDVHAGTVDGITGAADTHHPVQGVLATLDPLASYDLAVPAEHRLFAHVLRGTVTVGDRLLSEGQVGWSDPVATAGETLLPLAAPDGELSAKIMVYSGTPLHEPVALGGPFVMNTKPEIAQAFRDFHDGVFGPVPRLARVAH
ncbi:redox-sensitive bicupin YhaK (pirin superfamily) [Kibdelosporangium banguiense]|uniref:Redox-sensitive bicupin YhaK (Pirin superfamily) n=1 Tax=Kibdelosporangium banguiense TaxID=1365924 RepID=A0ABS4TS12_9PSEU|nr:pirin family protein [Kibdelosporangium banguiense]MBP2327194.1 redox-sensitive bicupin YhaK (pirin superfamily) [Kibdelosporangium banguiense]